MEFVKKEFPKGFFDIVIGAEEVRAHKPQSFRVNTSNQGLQSDLEKCIYIGGGSIID